MKLQNRILSTILAVITMMSALTGALTVGASAAKEETVVLTPEIIESTYTSAKYTKPEDRLMKMDMIMETADYQKCETAIKCSD